jgi:orotidine-5'-phosphate decarboxylase
LSLNARDLAASKIMIALDAATANEAEQIVEKLKGIPCWMKVGMQLFYAAGPSFVRDLKRAGYRVFLDLKMHDIPNTVKGGAGSITRLGVDMFNVHAAGGLTMMKAAMEGVEEGIASGQSPFTGASGDRPLVIGVTQLTSTSRVTMNDEIGISGTVEDAVLRYAELSAQAGLHGVVASPLEVVAIKDKCGSGFLTVTPGIRPAGAVIGDQARVMTPVEAIAQGTDYIVIGRPVTSAPNPRLALESIMEELI